MFQSIVNLFFPKVCYACSNYLSDNENDICIKCRHDLPVTNYHFEDPNAVKKVFYGRVKLENATALFRFEKKSIVQQLLHNLKYRGYEKIGEIFGDWLGVELSTIEDYKTIDAIIPVPLHNNKLRKRGYNQVTKFGQQIAKALKVDYVDNVLVKVSKSNTQVFKTRFARWQNRKELFDVIDIKKLEKKHVLLVDDIITTGATIEACALQLNKAKGIKISVATMAIA